MSTHTFAELGVSRALVQALARRQITQPFPVQRLVIGDVLAGRDVLVKSPTGSGKTLAFGIPIVERIAAAAARPAALVLAPTRELTSQIVDEVRPLAQARGLRVCAVYGGVGLTRQASTAARSHILVATPGRLEDLLARGAFTLDAIRILALDEADRMLDMGFRPAVERIIDACPKGRQTLLFSATLDGEAGHFAKRYTRDAVLREQGSDAPRSAPAIEHRFITVASERRVHALVEELAGERALALVFVRTKRGADRLVRRLGSHGDESQRQREQALARFESGAIDTMVATDVAARGIDVAGISHVINFDPPGDRDSYVHRVGRTARAGRSGIGITLVSSGERREVRRLAEELGIAHELSGSAAEHHRRHPAPAARSRTARPGGGSRRRRAGA